MGALAEVIIDDMCVGNKYSNRDNILAYEEIAETLPQLKIPVKHYIHGGMYAREITIPKNSILTGAIYKFDHFDIMVSGDITVSTDTGESKRLTGYNLFDGLSGKKRAGVAHEDTTWITIHPFTGEDGDSIQEFLTAKTFEELEDFNVFVNRQDFKFMLQDLNITEEQIQYDMKQGDKAELTEEYNNIYTSVSLINGEGIFSTVRIEKGSIVCPARIDGKRTIGGRFTNHALYPNSFISFDNNECNIVSNRTIERDEEITLNYRDVISFRQAKDDL